MNILLGFDKLITPKLLVLFYWISMILIFAFGINAFLKSVSLGDFFFSLSLLGGTFFALIFCRVCYELIMIAFKNNEYLRKISESINK